jgi:hypothetical protein
MKGNRPSGDGQYCSSGRPRGNLLKEVVFFIGGAGGADHADCSAAVFVANVSKTIRNQRERLVPRSGLQLSFAAYQRLLQPIGMIDEVKGIPSFNTKKIPIDPGLVAVASADEPGPGWTWPYT